MSRASDLRDAVVTQLASAFPSNTVDTFTVPDWTKEELVEDGAHIGVRVGQRQVEIVQGVDRLMPVIEVAVVGALPTGNRATRVAAADVLDATVESVIDLWIAGGSLRDTPLAEHRFQDMEQAAINDARQLYDNGVWLSVISLTFRDLGSS